VWILLAVVAVVITIVIVKALLRPPAATISLSDQIEQALSSGQPAVFIFTNGGPCCEATRKAFDDYNEQVSVALGNYGSRVKAVWLDIALEDSGSIQAMSELAGRYGVEYVPSLLLVSATGESLWLKAGLTTTEEVRAGLAAALGG
jgi:hypothetical protein